MSSVLCPSGFGGFWGFQTWKIIFSQTDHLWSDRQTAVLLEGLLMNTWTESEWKDYFSLPLSSPGQLSASGFLPASRPPPGSSVWERRPAHVTLHPGISPTQTPQWVSPSPASPGSRHELAGDPGTVSLPHQGGLGRPLTGQVFVEPGSSQDLGSWCGGRDGGEERWRLMMVLSQRVLVSQ